MVAAAEERGRWGGGGVLFRWVLFRYLFISTLAGADGVLAFCFRSFFLLLLGSWGQADFVPCCILRCMQV